MSEQPTPPVAGSVGSPPPGEVVLSAPAKLTVSLRITGVRSDGYHLLDAEMVTVDLADELRVTPISADVGGLARGGQGRRLGDRRGLTTAGASDDTGPLEVVEAGRGLPVAAGAANSVSRALAAAGRRAAVRLVKRIPAGAGLGGGSADAAAILRWCGVTDLAVAADLGADVPFCMLGGRARVRGVGEVLEPLPFEDRAFTLLIPPFGCSTPAVYRTWDELRPRPAVRGAGRNDLEAAALVVEPRLAEWRDRLAEATGQQPTLAGSGSTWFVAGAFPGNDRVVVRTCR